MCIRDYWLNCDINHDFVNEDSEEETGAVVVVGEGGHVVYGEEVGAAAVVGEGVHKAGGENHSDESGSINLSFIRKRTFDAIGRISSSLNSRAFHQFKNV